VRIALVTRRYPPDIGGAEKMLSYLAHGLAAEGAELVVLTAAAAPSARSDDSSGGVRVVRLPTVRIRFIGTWMYMSSLRDWLSHNKFDIAYVSMLKHDAYIAVGVGQRRGIPVVLRPEGAGATGDIAWQSWGRFGRVIGKRCRQADAVVAISPAIHRELISGGYDESRIHDLPNGVPVPDEPWRPPDPARSDPRVIYTGRLAPEKGLDVLLESWPRLLAKCPGARLFLVGEGPARPALEQQVERLGLRRSVELQGAMPDVTSLLRSADVFALPSREEGMSIALLEALALGMPVIASAIPGNQQVLIDGVHGRLVAPGNPAVFAAAIVGEWSDRAASQARGQAGRRRVIERFSIAAVAKQHLALFERLSRRFPGDSADRPK
jgi:glycosyltransferase involved in cell wall biosynthesis